MGYIGDGYPPIHIPITHTIQEEQFSKPNKSGPDSHHHGLTVVTTTTHGESHFLLGFCPFNLLILWLVNC